MLSVRFCITGLFVYAQKLDVSTMDFDEFAAKCSIEKLFPDYEIFKDLCEEDIKSHNENVKWLRDYFGKPTGDQK